MGVRSSWDQRSEGGDWRCHFGEWLGFFGDDGEGRIGGIIEALEVEAFDAAPIGLGDSDDVVFDANLFPLFGELAIEMSDIATDRADVGAFEFEISEVAKFVEADATLDSELVGVEAFELGIIGIKFVVDFADEFFEDVIESDDADCAPEFINDEAEVGVSGEEKGEEFFEGHHFWDGENIATNAEHIGLGLAEEFKEIFDVNDADRVIEVTIAEGEAGVSGVDGALEIFFEGVFGVEESDFAARGGDIADDAIGHIESVDEDGLTERGDFFGAFAFGEDDAEFFFAVGEIVFADWLDAEEGADEPIGDGIEEPDGWSEEGVEEAEGARDPEGGGDGFADGEDFGGLFAEGDVEGGDGGESDRESGVLDHRWGGDADFQEKRLEHLGEERFADPAEAEAGESDSELAGGEVGFEILGEMMGEGGGGVAVFGHGLELGGADFNEGEFGGDEEAVEEDEGEDRGEFEGDGGGVFPLGGGSGGGSEEEEVVQEREVHRAVKTKRAAGGDTRDSKLFGRGLLTSWIWSLRGSFHWKRVRGK